MSEQERVRVDVERLRRELRGAQRPGADRPRWVKLDRDELASLLAVAVSSGAGGRSVSLTGRDLPHISPSGPAPPSVPSNPSEYERYLLTELRWVEARLARVPALVEALHATRLDLVNVAREGQDWRERGQRGLEAIGRIDAALAEWEQA